MHFLQEAFLVSPTCLECTFFPIIIHLYVPVDMSLSHSTRRVLWLQEQAVLPFVRTHSAPTKCLAHSMTSINIYEKKKRQREGGGVGGDGEITISQNLRAHTGQATAKLHRVLSYM